MNKLQELIEVREVCRDALIALYNDSKDVLDMVVNTLIEQLGGDSQAVEVINLETGRCMMRPAPPTWDKEIKMYGIKILVVFERLFNGIPEGVEFDLYARVYKGTYWLNVGGSAYQKSTEMFRPENDEALYQHLNRLCAKQPDSIKRLFTQGYFRDMGVTMREPPDPDLAYLGFRGEIINPKDESEKQLI